MNGVWCELAVWIIVLCVACVRVANDFAVGNAPLVVLHEVQEEDRVDIALMPFSGARTGPVEVAGA